MNAAREHELPDEMFLVEVTDEETGETRQTLSISSTPTILLSFAANRFTEAASNFFKERFGLGSVDWRMLFMLAQHPGTTAAHASRTIGIDKGAVSRCLHLLADKQLAFAGALHPNGRSRGWHLTRKGIDLHDRILTAALERQRHLLRGFEPAEIEVLCVLLKRFLNNLDAM